MSATKIPPFRKEIFTTLAHHRSRFIGGLGGDHDFSLADLSAGLGMLGAQITGNETAKPGEPFNHQPILEKIAAHAIGWLEKIGVKNPFDLIHAERERQEKLFRAGKFNFTCASKTAGAKRKFRILFEECGEVAQEVDALEYTTRATHAAAVLKRLQTELVQVAAVAVAWLEALESK